MNNNMIITLLMIGGLVLIYASIKGTDPRDLVKQALKRGQ